MKLRFDAEWLKRKIAECDDSDCMCGPGLTTEVLAMQIVSDQKVRITELSSVLAEVMSWISNWSPNFIEDDEWAETEAKVKRVLG